MKKFISAIIFIATLSGCSQSTLDMPSRSMEPTIPEGSKVTVDFSAYSKHTPARFDIVAFRPPHPPNAIFVFRVIGLPGETVELTQESVSINSEVLIAPNNLEFHSVLSGITKVALGDTEYFLLGDNVAVANDSRSFGAIDINQILGKVTNIEPPVAPNPPPSGPVD